MDKADKPSVCFFMPYYKRPEVTRMSMWHMAKVLKKFRDAGHECDGFVVGNEPEQKEYAESLGLEHLEFPNNPLWKKFEFTWRTAILREKTYICKLDSNNVCSDDFWNKCIAQINKPEPTITFGTKNFTIVHSDFLTQTTRTWERRKWSFCSVGQFFLTSAVRKSVQPLNKLFSVRKANVKENRDFDGSINLAITEKYGRMVFHDLESDPLDCIDLKTAHGVDIHSFDVYNKEVYKMYYTRDQIFDMFEELKMLEDRQFNVL